MTTSMSHSAAGQSQQLGHSETAESQPAAGSAWGLVLSMFPGIDLLGRAFRRSGWCVTQGPDRILGDDIRDWFGIAGRFDGIIGGSPCQDFSRKRRHPPTGNGVRMLREFARAVTECEPTWWMLENVPGVPDLEIPGWAVQRLDLSDFGCGGSQWRLRHIQYGHRHGWIIRPARSRDLPNARLAAGTVLCVPENDRLSYVELCRRQGLAEPLRLPGWSRTAKCRAIGNAVPWRMGLVLAEAACGAGPVTANDCVCLCGRRVTPPARHATDACRKRMERRRRGHGLKVSLAQSQPDAADGHAPARGHSTMEAVP